MSRRSGQGPEDGSGLGRQGRRRQIVLRLAEQAAPRRHVLCRLGTEKPEPGGAPSCSRQAGHLPGKEVLALPPSPAPVSLSLSLPPPAHINTKRRKPSGADSVEAEWRGLSALAVHSWAWLSPLHPGPTRPQPRH